MLPRIALATFATPERFGFSKLSNAQSNSRRYTRQTNVSRWGSSVSSARLKMATDVINYLRFVCARVKFATHSGFVELPRKSRWNASMTSRKSSTSASSLESFSTVAVPKQPRRRSVSQNEVVQISW